MIKSILKALAITFLIIIVVLGITGFIIYMDAMQLKESLEGQKTFLLIHDNTMEAGLRVNPVATSNDVLKGSLIQEYNEDELRQIQQYYSEGKFESIATKEELLIIIDSASFTGTEILTVDGKEVNLTKGIVDGILKAGTIAEAVNALEPAKLTNSEKQAIIQQYSSVQAFKNFMFQALFIQNLEDGTDYLIKNYEEGYIIIKPEFITLKVLKYIPSIGKSLSKAEAQ